MTETNNVRLALHQNERWWLHKTRKNCSRIIVTSSTSKPKKVQTIFANTIVKMFG